MDDAHFNLYGIGVKLFFGFGFHRLALCGILAVAVVLLKEHDIVNKDILCEIFNRSWLFKYFLYDLFSPLWVLLRSLLMMRKDERVWR